MRVPYTAEHTAKRIVILSILKTIIDSLWTNYNNLVEKSICSVCKLDKTWDNNLFSSKINILTLIMKYRGIILITILIHLSFAIDYQQQYEHERLFFSIIDSVK